MKELHPFETLEEALSALDNGGRFYNLFSHPRDGTITAGELKKAEGVISLLAGSFLYFELMPERLSVSAKESVIAALDSELQQNYRSNPPRHVTGDELGRLDQSTTSVIVEGVPVFCSEQSKFTCFITIPVQTGSVPSSIMIPIHEQYSMYTMGSGASDEVPVAIPQDYPRLPEESVKVGGFLENASSDQSGENSEATYLAVRYVVESSVDSGT